MRTIDSHGLPFRIKPCCRAIRRLISQSGPSSRLAPKRTGEDHSPGSALAQQATRRPQAAAPLTVILLGSRLERREDGRLRAGAIGGRDGGQPVTGSARGHARAAARRAPAGAKAEAASPVTCESRGRLRPPAERGRWSPRPPGVLPRVGSRARGARRAPRALEDVEKVLTSTLICSHTNHTNDTNDRPRGRPVTSTSRQARQATLDRPEPQRPSTFAPSLTSEGMAEGQTVKGTECHRALMQARSRHCDQLPTALLVYILPASCACMRSP
jgi:hypothetical protein